MTLNGNNIDWMDAVPNGSLFHYRYPDGLWENIGYVMQRQEDNGNWTLVWKADDREIYSVDYSPSQIASAMSHGSTINGLTEPIWRQMIYSTGTCPEDDLDASNLI